MSLGRLDWFCFAYETGSFAQAAKLAFVTRQAFGKGIRALECDLGAELFVRNETGIEPTDTAKEIYPLVKRCLLDYELIKKTCERATPMRSELRIAISDGAVESLPADFFDLLEGSFPEVEFILEKHFFIGGINLVRQGEVDFALSPAPLKEEGLESIPLVRERLFVAVPPEIVEAPPSSLTLQQMAELPFFMVGDSDTGDLGCRDYCARRGVTLKSNTQYSDYEVILRKVNAGQGCCLVPESVVHRIDDRISLVPFPEDGLRFEIHFVMRNEKYQDVAREVIEYMRRKSTDLLG